MATYLGNPSLAGAVKERVNSTFQQAVALFKQGRTEEVTAGCNLILQMDPLFDPARKLLQKVQNPSLAIDVDKLMGRDDTASSMEEARTAMAARDFQRVIQLTTEILTEDLMNDEARILGDEAREKQEAAPFIEQFARKCEQHLAAGNLPAARGDLEKARSLDGANPTLAQMEQKIAAASKAASQPASPAPQPAAFSFDATPFVVDAPANPSASGRTAAQATDFGFSFEEDKSASTAAATAAPQEGTGGFGSPGDEGPVSFNPTSPAPSPAAAPTPPAASQSFSFDSGNAASPSGSGFSNFSFDAPASGGFSFDAGAAAHSNDFNFGPTPAKSAVTGEFDFSSASLTSSPDDQKKIEQYLDEGDREFASGNYQQAIDLWSRIFLIDVTNEQASERIERAKGKRREIDQKIDDILAGAVHAFNRKDYDAARPRFAEVLRLDPANTSARDYMAKLGAVAAAPAASAAAPGVSGSYTKPSAGTFETEEPGESPGAPLMPPDQAPAAADTRAAKPSRATAQTTTSRRLPKVAILAVVAVLILGAGGWLAWQKFTAQPEDTTTSTTVLAQATKLADAGKFDAAITMLQEVKPGDPLHDRAVSMMADYQHRRAQAAERIDGRPVAQFFQEQLTAARAAFDAHDYDGAKKAFEQAQRAKPLPADLRQLYDAASQQVAKLDAAKALFRERRFDEAINNLQPLLQQDPQNKSVQRMILDAHFNLGATALQEERLADAITQFDEVLKVDPNDELARRSKELATRYNGQPKDLLYKIYVKYLPLRQLA